MTTQVPRVQWERDAQSGELAFHRGNASYRGTDRFAERTAQIMGDAGFTAEQFAGRWVLDVGAGSRLRSSFFAGANLAVLEPLALQFSELEWCDLSSADEVWPIPVEDHEPTLDGRFDLVMSINALDHCFDFAAAVRNMARYKADRGLVFAVFDCREKANKLHPLTLTRTAAFDAFTDAGLEVTRIRPGSSFGSSGSSIAVYAR